jgi:hypothetical protein
MIRLIRDLNEVTIVTSDLAVEKKYAGTYADLPEQEEKDLISELQNTPWNEVVYQRYFEKQPWLYRIITDQGRAQFLDLIHFKEDGTYLDIGSGWGQVSIPLAKYGHSVALDLTRNRLDILAEIARQENVSLTRLQGNFLTFPFKHQLFDLIIFNGSLEWIASGRESHQSIKEVQLDALIKSSELLKNDGKVYIGIENSLGAKYLTGTNDDHTGVNHLMYLSEDSAIKKYRKIKESELPVKTWSLTEYEELFNMAGLEVEKVYACFPDYKLIRTMVQLEDVNNYILNYSHTVLEHDGADGHILKNSDELIELYKTLALSGIAQYFCPSYGFVLKKRG